MSKKSLLALDKPTNHPENGQSLNCSSHYSLSRDLPSILLRLKAACISIHGRWMVFYIDTRTGGQGGAGLGVTDWEEKYAFIISFRQMPLTTILIFQIMQPENRQRRYIWTLIIFMNFLYFVKKHASFLNDYKDGRNQFYVFHMMLPEYNIRLVRERHPI